MGLRCLLRSNSAGGKEYTNSLLKPIIAEYYLNGLGDSIAYKLTSKIR